MMPEAEPRVDHSADSPRRQGLSVTGGSSGSGWNPKHRMIGWDGYFGNRLSLPELRHSKKRDLLPDTISLEWTHSSQRLGIIRGPVRFSMTSCVWL
jgi:hypothetical protein